ncbi:hypothetical protein HN748_01430 [Candidatus Peregrinibacteria bacterium]|jgi:hypothetical protein|nr:hypothetical protein [Candidatus Peregrinibacteria bacterium]MBT7484353.1 hypothetical protein [Candidatus Peregrinibacteria bacterium]MBT7702872.1 hypothetical protein [Candidatus Peregrinibacteria bacterium]
MNQLRNQEWLEDRLRTVWMRGFSDVTPENTVTISFGRRARTRLGSIRLDKDKKKTRILINRLFSRPEVPLQIVDATIAHEIVHYVHGFGSPFEQKFCTPHAGGVVTREMKERGFGKELIFQKKWLKNEWPKFLKMHGPTPRKRRRYRKQKSLLVRLLLGSF